ncbi:tRNA (guanosine(37)-N1)-methyltransferase TrmD [Leptotrichia buccalis]|uniref:tRNA (guanine-N(1)-)-methyltransferase n=1 Tax=Leptotrichia buccalis (strain ATCC 14201 / DSM 1135 / JCM 12969 / NCTC 10249 / C-1013-b) TaxID=523794 RepID=C7N9T5_LEPBD|nr:tRNA (guanosine(37)-N1)-methyltransferase TrmD [Leptotrichia buccalis]ACV38916.1 tRNA (guanine-N1)-methyltransferase [Leptotrichia buccalis C-1013-b]
MKFNVLTLFPELFEQYLSQTILKRAIDKDIIDFNIVNIRDYARNKHSQMDDIPFGGGAGMVLKPEAYWNFFYENYEFYNNENSDLKKPYVIFLSPQGKQLTHKKVTELSEKEEIVLISGRYEGLDQRVIDKFVDEEISIGDYVLSSGDLPCLVIMDSVIRIKEGVIKKESFETDSFYNGLLGFPQYTRPVEIDGYSVPEVLRSGNHAKIDEYRQLHSIEKTMKNRMDLFEKKLAEDEEFLKLCEKYKLKLK